MDSVGGRREGREVRLQNLFQHPVRAAHGAARCGARSSAKGRTRWSACATVEGRLEGRATCNRARGPRQNVDTEALDHAVVTDRLCAYPTPRTASLPRATKLFLWKSPRINGGDAHRLKWQRVTRGDDRAAICQCNTRDHFDTGGDLNPPFPSLGRMGCVT